MTPMSSYFLFSNRCKLEQVLVPDRYQEGQRSDSNAASQRTHATGHGMGVKQRHHQHILQVTLPITAGEFGLKKLQLFNTIIPTGPTTQRLTVFPHPMT